ncbi:5'-nucleotidase C-terminal domain-containing protein [Oceanirhabdus seepicola]|uniref:5'-nucleotidase C-terminal domain-containing protein n=1 Tax=Oceanirhabdus seepicola TaxID=2828781 RepID=A0A9J6NWZ1_9CLOT|nr:5'-nucleotidase C-terminal domain-containing protein [Oceanirhabdus seepicola]MCM1988580.1 5'-nucleotidase C-terminal domain-containing protein [Oceanirhabdus seepicola]
MQKVNKSKFTALLVALIMMITVISPMSVFAEGETSEVKDLTKKEEKQLNEDEVEIQILATSDVHGRFMPYDYAVNASYTKGSLTQVLTAINELREQNPNTILVDNGDTIQDNSSALFLNDEIHPMILAMNKMGFDVWSVGNHEFNYGVPALQKIIDQFEGETLGGNVYNADGSRIAKPYTIIERAGVKVGIIGMVTPNIVNWDAANLKGYTVTNPIEETRKAIDEIKDKVDVLIAVNHMGEESQYGIEGSGAIDIAKNFPELTAIVTGHAHSKIVGDYYYDGKVYTSKDATDEVKRNGVLMIEPYKYANALGQITLKFTKEDGKYIIKDKATDIKSDLYYMYDKNEKKVAYESDKELEKSLESYNQRAIDDANKLIGELKEGNLVAENEIKDIPRAQLEPTAAIQIVNDVQMFYGKQIAGKDIDVAAAALFRADQNVMAGPIKKSDLALLYKYDNTLYVVEMTGKQLKQYMEWSAQYFNTFNEGDLTVSFDQNIRSYNYDMFGGVTYNIDITKEAGNRIVDLKNNNEEVKDEDVLLVAVNNYRANSHLLKYGVVFQEGDELPKKIGGSDDLQYGLGDGRIRDLIGKYIVEEKNGVITPEVEMNWSLIGNNWDKEDRAKAVELINEGKIIIPRSEDGRTPNVASVTVEQVKEALGVKEEADTIITTTTTTTTYVVKAGDMLWKIGRDLNVDYNKIGEINNLDNLNLIFVGQELLIPVSN